MLLDTVGKLSQHYSRCSMADLLPTWPVMGLSPGVSKTGDSLLLKVDEDPQNRLGGKTELSQNVRFDGRNHFRGPNSQGLCKMCKKE